MELNEEAKGAIGQLNVKGQTRGSPTRSASCERLESGNSMRLRELNPLNKSFTSSSGMKTSPFSFRYF